MPQNHSLYFLNTGHFKARKDLNCECLNTFSEKMTWYFWEIVSVGVVTKTSGITAGVSSRTVHSNQMSCKSNTIVQTLVMATHFTQAIMSIYEWGCS